MINISGIPNATLLGRAIRLPLRAVPQQTRVRILQGPLRGKRWFAGSSNHGCWLGSYETKKQRVVASVLRPGMVCWDIGANVGFYTLLIAELVGSTGKVFAFEPLPANVDILRQHVAMNGYRNVTIFPDALGNMDSEVRFDPRANASMGRISAAGGLTVPCLKADTVIASGQARAPDVVKIDVEGAEADVLRGASRLFRNHPILFLVTHGDVIHRECLELLAAFDYEVCALGGGSPECTDERVAVGKAMAPQEVSRGEQ